METPDVSLKRLLIIGAGDPGADLCKQALSNRTFRFKPVAFVDDHPDLHGTSILGVPIAGRLDRIPQVVKEYDADIAVIALHDASTSENFAVVELCRSAGVPFKILPTMLDLLEGPVNINRIRDVDPADLLGRAPAKLDRVSIETFICGKHVLVTGAAGSVGSELARHIAGFNPKLLFLLDHSENSLLFLEAEIRASFPEVSLVAHVCDVTAYDEMERVMAEYRPQLVFHAAAHKHVPLMERTPGKAVKNNVGGTYTLARCAMNAGVDTFVLVSTDKAVNPTSVMGATKRLAELMLQELDQGSNTRSVSVRFGNVLGSNASVVSIFKQQIANSGPVTVTHPDVQRYFMSVSEAVGLILQAGAVGRGGDILVLDMGVPVKIVSLAETLISLSGLRPYEDIDIVFTGLRAGEKMSEELSFDDEVFDTTGYEKLWVLKQGVQTEGIVPRLEEMLSVLPKLTADEVKLRLKGFIPEYGPESLVREVVGPAHGGNRPSPTL